MDDAGGSSGCGSVLVVFPASRGCAEVVRTGIDRARAAGRDLVVVTIVAGPHPTAHLQGLGGSCVADTHRLRDELTSEGAARCRAAAEMAPRDVSVESRLGFERPDRLVESELRRRAIARLVLHEGWSRKRWMRRALRRWGVAQLPVELA